MIQVSTACCRVFQEPRWQMTAGLNAKTAANHIGFERTRRTVETNLSIMGAWRLAPWHLLES